MEIDRHSVTAVMMAAVRAYHHAGPEPRIFDDEFAHSLLTPAEFNTFERTIIRSMRYLDPELAASFSNRATIINQALRAGAAGPLVRARYIEDALHAAADQGIRQYVIIGAGLDTFAFRNPNLRDRLRIIEIDHPSTQALKLDRLARAGLVPPINVSFAAADLEHEDIAGALLGAHYDETLPAFFAWPGVTMYLTRKAIFGTLHSIVNMAGSGSELAFDYVEPEAFSPDAPVHVRFALHRSRRLGEPIVTGLAPATLASELASIGLQMIEDLSPAQIQGRFLECMGDFRAVEYCHLVRASIGPPPLSFGQI
jgi:methyltransferase (TIGR00027 family)